MARYRKISTRIWNDRKFMELSDDAKLLFVFLLSHPHMTPLGAMRANIPGLACELGWTPERLREAFGKALERGMVRLDERASCVFLPNFLKHNLPESPNVVTAWEKCMDDIPECELKLESFRVAREVSHTLSEGFRKAFGRLPEVFAKGMPNQEQEQEQEQDIKYFCPETSKTDVSGPEQGGSCKRKNPEQTPEKKSSKKPDEPQGPVFIGLPSNSGQEFPVTEPQVVDWQSLYGGVDVRRELRAMRGWLDARPANKRKTVSGMKRFIVGWLKSAQDKGAQSQRPSPRGMSPVSPAGSFQGDLGFFGDAMKSERLGKEL